MHARSRMQSRRVSEEQVAATLADPDNAYFGRQGRLVAEKSFGPGATVRVVFVDRLGPQGRYTHVITVMWK